MHSAQTNKVGRMVGWVAFLFVGIPGLIDLTQGVLKSNLGLAMYGLGRVMCAGFFVIYPLGSTRLLTVRARVLRLMLGYSGLALGIAGFLLHAGLL